MLTWTINRAHERCRLRIMSICCQCLGKCSLSYLENMSDLERTDVVSDPNGACCYCEENGFIGWKWVNVVWGALRRWGVLAGYLWGVMKMSVCWWKPGKEIIDGHKRKKIYYEVVVMKLQMNMFEVILIVFKTKQERERDKREAAQKT